MTTPLHITRTGDVHLREELAPATDQYHAERRLDASRMPESVTTPPALHMPDQTSCANPACDPAAAPLICLSSIHKHLGYRDLALVLTPEAQASIRPMPVPVASFICRGTFLAARGNLYAGAEQFHQAIDLSQQIGDVQGRALARYHLARFIYLPRGQFELALAILNECVAIDLLPGYLLCRAILLCAEIYQRTGEQIRAAQILEDVYTSAAPDPWIAGYCTYLRACLAMDLVQLEPVDNWLHMALSIADESGNPYLIVRVRMALSRWYCLAGEVSSARQWAIDALSYARRAEVHHLVGQAFIEAGQAAWRAGDLQVAETDLRMALEVLAPLEAACDLARAMLILAALYHQRDDPQAETTWLDAAHRISVGGYAFVLERERALAFPLIAAYLHSEQDATRIAAEKLLQQVQRTPPLPLHILGLGRFEVRQGYRRIDDQVWQQRKAGHLLRMLLLSPGHTMSCVAIRETIWPERSSASSRNLLHQATSMLRRILEPDLPEKFPSRYVHVADEQMTLHLPPGSTSDFMQFEQQMTRALSTDDPASLGPVLANYAGDLFPADGPADWCMERREHLMRLYLRGLQQQAAWHLAAGRHRQARDTCDQILGRDPWSEEAVLLGMRACLALNDRPAAMRRYRDYRRTIRRDLNLPPRADIQALADAIQIN